jgi:hypothetical protein
MEVITIVDMARELGISSSAAIKRLQRKGIRPFRYIGSAGVYKASDLEAIREGGKRGRPWPAKDEPTSDSETASTAGPNEK